MEKVIVIGSNNKGKVDEISIFLQDLDLKIHSLKDYRDCIRVDEEGESFDDNAIKKAVSYAKFTKEFTLADDSGIEVDVLGGKPGPLSSRFAGDYATDYENNAKLLRLLEGVLLERRKASFKCSIALADKDGLIKVVRGSCSGLIAFEMKGTNGFGYDSIFLPPNHKKTFAELDPAIKNRFSHRAKALQKVRKIIKDCFAK